MNRRVKTTLAALDDALSELGSNGDVNGYDEWLAGSVRATKTTPMPFLDGVIIQRLDLC